MRAVLLLSFVGTVRRQLCILLLSVAIVLAIGIIGWRVGPTEPSSKDQGAAANPDRALYWPWMWQTQETTMATWTTAESSYEVRYGSEGLVEDRQALASDLLDELSRRGFREAWPAKETGFSLEFIQRQPYARNYRSVAVGFPFRCLRSSVLEIGEPTTLPKLNDLWMVPYYVIGVGPTIVAEGIRLPTGGSKQLHPINGMIARVRAWQSFGFDLLSVVPTEPLWRGLIGNVALFHCVISLICGAPIYMLASVALKERRCAFCGYGPFPAGAVCPECGQNRVE